MKEFKTYKEEMEYYASLSEDERFRLAELDRIENQKKFIEIQKNTVQELIDFKEDEQIIECEKEVLRHDEEELERMIKEYKEKNINGYVDDVYQDYVDYTCGRYSTDGIDCDEFEAKLRKIIHDVYDENTYIEEDGKIKTNDGYGIICEDIKWRIDKEFGGC